MDTATKRRAALRFSTMLLPAPGGSIGADSRAILMRVYPISLLSTPNHYVQADVEICSTGYVDVEL